jgi:methylated-DNA-[protein]-cysteine S-methyltransferase
MAAAWNNGCLQQVTFGHDWRHTALAALHYDGMAVEIEDLGKLQRDLVARLQSYALAKREEFADVDVDLSHLTDFQRRVVAHCRRIAYGRTLSYAELAARAGSPRAARAVGNVMAANRFPLIVPCHRVVAASDSPGGYSAPQGIRMKLRLLEQEGGTAWPRRKPQKQISNLNFKT